MPRCLPVADLGCSSGPNALALASAAVDAVRRHQPSVAEQRCREISVYLNDLPNNDFNTVFKDVPPFLREHEEAESGGEGPLVMVFGAPGSFYGRLFPAETLHLVCSSFSLYWLSQVPQELVDGLWSADKQGKRLGGEDELAGGQRSLHPAVRAGFQALSGGGGGRSRPRRMDGALPLR
ncbi:probable methyltransferase TCM_000336 [Setaria viridis]|uniref:Jasmonate O-methyltransferase n=1 Tax=Setaria viridis TaxID=4556 RepID=A0A4U6SVD9_SETVI|nr:salicylate carboxymethyltransferase-like [Setaria viridis]TKV92907.1 hypothetical protein SEVIR_9G191700v2 [Setaria viridis]